MKTKNLKVAAIGAATQDVFLMGSALKAKRDVRTHDFVEQFALGSKLELDRIVFATGGGATNAAVTFARHGFETYFLGKIGDDPAGEHVLKDLRGEHVKTDLVKCDIAGTTGYSTLLLAPKGERTILVYRGVSQELAAADFGHFAKLKADWLYITSLAGNFPLLEAIVDYASTHGIKIAIDPGSQELAQAERFKQLVPKFEILKGNKEELGQLFSGQDARTIATSAATQCHYVVVTDGPNGAWASDGEYVYQAGVYEDVPVLDRTGAGDAFGSGLVAKIAAGASMQEALTFAGANSTSVVQHIGAKEGILSKDATLKEVEITKTKIKTKEPTHA